MYYSATLFGDPSGESFMTPAMASCMIVYSNIFGSLFGIWLLSRCGRRTIMIGTEIVVVVCMLGLAFFSTIVDSKLA